MVLKNLDIRDVFPQKHMNSHVYPKWQGNAIMFPALITILLGNPYVLKRVFCVSSRLKSVVVFLAQAHPNRCFFCQKLFTVRDQKREERNFPKSHDNCQKNKAKKQYNRYNLTYNTFSII